MKKKKITQVFERADFSIEITLNNNKYNILFILNS